MNEVVVKVGDSILGRKKMRTWTPVMLLGVVLVGCGPAIPEKPIDPGLTTVTMEVRGMT